MAHKSPNKLMRYLRDVKGISINGSRQKQALRNMGYYHGYKGYRFYGSTNTPLPYTDFLQVKAVYDFDMQVKTLLYPWVMFLETAFKNHALEIVMPDAPSEIFEDICKSVLSNAEPGKLLGFYRAIYDALSRDYSKQRPVITHFYDQNKPVPIWALFEIISMGNFGAFVERLKPHYRTKLSQAIGLPLMTNLDQDCKLPQYLVYALRDLRNAIAHNAPIYDVRFNLNNKHGNRTVHKCVGTYMRHETGAAVWKWDTIADYVLLIAQLLMRFGVDHTEIKRDLLDRFLGICDAFSNSVMLPGIVGIVIPQKGIGKVQHFRI